MADGGSRAFDGTVLSVAPPTLAKTLHASESDLQWFSSGSFSPHPVP